jgi:hypothetical protein
VEAGVSLGWHRWVGPKGRVQALDRYGASAPAAVAFENLGFFVERIEQIVSEILDFAGVMRPQNPKFRVYHISYISLGVLLSKRLDFAQV